MRLFGRSVGRQATQDTMSTDPEYERGWHIGFEAGIEVGRDMGPEEPENEEALDREDVIVRNFTYHPPKGDQIDRYHRVRDGAMDLALTINDITPVSREQSLALTKLEEFVFWANASIARNE